LNRVDDIVIFHKLGRAEIDRIVDLQLERLRKLLRERDLELDLSNDARTFLADRGYDPAYGARPLKRALQRYIQDPLAKLLLRGEFTIGDTIIAMRPKVVDPAASPAADEQLIFIKKRLSPVAAVS
jgi:ATP-dependent Clp protease ATP-binding subunit ClpB